MIIKDENKEYNLIDLVQLKMNDQLETVKSIVNDYKLMDEYLKDIDYQKLIACLNSSDFSVNFNDLITMYLDAYQSFHKSYEELYKLFPLIPINNVICAESYGNVINDHQKVYDYIINAFSEIEKSCTNECQIYDCKCKEFLFIARFFNNDAVNHDVDGEIIDVIKARSIYGLFDFTKEYTDSNADMIGSIFENAVNYGVDILEVFDKENALMIIEDALNGSSNHNDDAIKLVKNKSFMKVIASDHLDPDLVSFINSLDREKLDDLMKIKRLPLNCEDLKDSILSLSLNAKDNKIAFRFNCNKIKDHYLFYDDLEELIFDTAVQKIREEFFESA